MRLLPVFAAVIAALMLVFFAAPLLAVGAPVSGQTAASGSHSGWHAPPGTQATLGAPCVARAAGGVSSADGPSSALALCPYETTGEYVVGFDAGIDVRQAQSLVRQRGLAPVRWMPRIQAMVVRPESNAGAVESRGRALGAVASESRSGDPLSDSNTDTNAQATMLSAALHDLAAAPGVQYVEADAVAHVQMAPDDPRYSSHQWAPQRIGADDAWDTTTGVTTVVVAVVDSGLDMDHEDITGEWVQGRDIYNGDNDPSDDYGHGTWVSGVIGAGLDNGLGIASIGGDTRIMPVKVTDASGTSSYSRIASGVTWAVDNGADVINLSLGGTVDLANLRNAMHYAYDEGVLVVAAAGNDGSSNPFYPAAYTMTMGIAATTETDARWSSSNYGTWLSMAAPGSSIDTTNWTGNGAGDYVTAGGTSLAAPHVAGVASLIMAVRSDLSHTQVWDILESTALDLGDEGFDQYFGHGRVDADEAVRQAGYWLTATPTVSASATPESTTATPVPPTATPEPPTATPVPPTATPVPPTATPVPPTATPQPPTATPQPPTATPQPPTATPQPPTPSPTTTTGTLDTLYVSSTTGGSVGGVRFADEDVLAYDTQAETWSMYFDGSDVGVGRTDLDAFALMSNGDLLMSFSSAVSISGLGRVDDSDIVRFTPTSTGPATAGTFAWYFDGSDVGLTRNGEDVNAVALTDDGDLLISTTGRVRVPGVSGKDEDILEFEPDTLGSSTSGSWSMYFDGSDVGLSAAPEDTYGAWIDADSTRTYLTTRGAFSVPGLSGYGADVFDCLPSALGESTTCSFSPDLAWDGSSHGFGGETIDALFLVTE